MAQRETAWCLGAAELGRRPLDEEQRRVLGARLAQARRALKLWRTGWLTFWSAAVLLYPFCHEALAAGSAKPGAVPFLYFLFCSGPAAVLMAATELITGWSRLLRWIFVALGLGVLTLALESTFVGFASILAIYLGGTFAWAARWQIFRRLRTLLPELEADLREGVVAVFEVNRPEGEKPPATLSRAKVRFDGTPVRFAVLPRTGVLVDVAGRFVDTFLSFDRSWDPLDVTVTAQGTGYRAPIDGAPAELHDKIGQRHATPRHARRARGDRHPLQALAPARRRRVLRGDLLLRVRRALRGDVHRGPHEHRREPGRLDDRGSDRHLRRVAFARSAFRAPTGCGKCSTGRDAQRRCQAWRAHRRGAPHGHRHALDHRREASAVAHSEMVGGRASTGRHRHHRIAQ